MALVVLPPKLLPHVRTFLELTDEQIKDFLEALSKAGSKFNTIDLASDVADQTKLSKAMTEAIVDVLALLYVRVENQDAPLDVFLEQNLAPGLRAAFQSPVPQSKGKPKTAEEAEALWSRFKKFLTDSLVLDETVGTAAKAGPVMTEHERVFNDARILTDLRLIFHPDLSEKPNAAVIVHMLRLTARNQLNEQQAHFYALDSNDIRLMKQLIDRAIRKEETLRSVMSESDISIIEPKAFF